MAVIKRPEGPFTDETDRKQQIAAYERAVGAEVAAEQRELFEPTTAAYMQAMYQSIDDTVNEGTEATEQEARHQIDREAKAIRGLSADEARVCRQMDLKPSEYLSARDGYQDR